MKLKTLSCAIFAAFTLTACGGGSDGDSSYQGKDVQLNETEWASYASNYQADAENLFTKIKFTIQNNELYIKPEYLANATDVFDISQVASYYVTANSFYEISTLKTQIGYKLGTLISQSNSKWVITPYSLTNSKDLQLTENFELVDLTSKPMSEYIDTYSHFSGLNDAGGTFEKLYNDALKGQTFPKGSYCLRGTSSSTNTPYFESYNFDTVDSPELYFGSGNYNTSKLGNYPLYLSKETDPNYGTTALLNIENEYLIGDYHRQGVTYSLSSDIQNEREILKELQSEPTPDAYQIRFQENYIKSLEKECTFFNRTASQAIDIAQKIK